MNCVFCDIVARRGPASIVYEDDLVMAFMALQPTAPGECLVIPKDHVDEFADLPDAIAQRIVAVAQRVARRMRAVSLSANMSETPIFPEFSVRG